MTPTKTTRHRLHDLDNPPVQTFTSWRALLVKVEKEKITGYAVDSEGEVVNFKKGMRRGTNGKWNCPAAGGAA